MNFFELKRLVQVRIDKKTNIKLDEKVVHDGAPFGERQIYFCPRRIPNKKST
jgi:hypothetical protein